MCQRLATFKLFRRSTEVCTRKNTTLTMLQMKGSSLIMSRASFLVSTLHSLLQAFTNLCTDTGASLASQTVQELASIADQITVQNGSGKWGVTSEITVHNGYILASTNSHGLK